MWALLAVSTAFLTSFNPLLYKRMLQNADTIVVVWAVNSLSLPVLGLFTFVATRRLPAVDGIFIAGVIGSAVLNVFAHLASVRALKLSDVSLVTPLLIFSPIFTMLISALFLGEIPSVTGLIGVGCVLAGAYWLNRTPGTGWLGPFRVGALAPGVVLVLLAGALWAVTPLLEKAAILHTTPRDPRLAAFAATALLSLMLTPLVARAGRSGLSRLIPHHRDLLIAGSIAGVAPVLGYTAFSLGLLGYVTTLFQLSTLLTVLWSSIFLKEPGAARRLPAVLLMVLGAILISL